MNIVLYQPEIPQNTGNIARTCVAVGAKLWLVRPLGFRIDDQRMRRAGLDYWQHLDLEVVDAWSRFVDEHHSSRMWFFTKSASKRHVDIQYEADDFLVFGSETNGLPRSFIDASKSAVRIPQSDNVRSLNLSNAVAVALYEALRQIDRLP